ncbi:MAG TPA: hypothetical protein PK079_21350 [Leptospiraceae bacterium]|nr:hypothetical protein [Leptospiraceae bacterium]HMX33114.1 hypothetical protein [Leptospiraceae bacterium]HMY33106.1 hypothetical protein [Leptospiraceae bacterium]HMZ64231.1 hypothetical protein [Leptospiraceae bacterium]HNA09822.1 hypothetical protein [Leptospiraceae bacterium]
MFIESNVSPAYVSSYKNYPEVKKVFGKKILEILVCHQEGNRVLGSQVPISILKKILLL